MKKGIVTGAFDLLHAGHAHFIEQCEKRCDYLIVALHIDPSIERSTKNKPIENIVERQIKLVNQIGVKNIWIYQTESELKLLFQYLKPDVRFLGSDYADLDKKVLVTDPDAIPIEYIDSLPIHTSDIRERIKNAG